MGYKRFVILVLALLLLYLSLYTWNLKNGVIDRLVGFTGLEAVGWVLAPGDWVVDHTSRLWHRYVYLTGVEAENETLREALFSLTYDNVRLREDATRAGRLERLLVFTPPPEWQSRGARVIAQELGPAGVLDTILVDRGLGDDASVDTPVLAPEGAVGRVLRVSPHFSTVLLLTDPASRIAVRGEHHRTTGILAGQGSDKPLGVLYVPLNAPMEVDEVLVTSGLAGIFPPGFPVARVTRIERSDISLFKTVRAEPLVDLKRLEEVLLMHRLVPAEPEGAAGADTPEQALEHAPSGSPAASGAEPPRPDPAGAEVPMERRREGG